MAVAAIPWAMAAMGAASAHMQNQPADAQVDAQNKQIDAYNRQVAMNNEASLEAMRDNYSAINDEQQKSAAESVQQSVDLQLDAIRGKSQLNLMAAATGMGGTSVEDMFYSLERDRDKSMSNIIGNYEDRVYELNQQAENVWNQTKGSLETRASKLNKPSSWSKAAGVIVGGVQGYMAGSDLSGALSAAAPAKATGSSLFDSLFKSKSPAPITKAGI